MSIVMIQIAVIVYSLSFFSMDWIYLEKLSFLTMFSQFTGILILVLLCKLRPILNRVRVGLGVSIVVGLVIVVTYLIVDFVEWLSYRLLPELIGSQLLDSHLKMKFMLVSLIIILALIRYFYVQDQWQLQVQELSNAKLKSLQSKIKPHFLFNTLNSIASLVSIDPAKAEKAVIDFSALMRRTFVKQEKTISLAEEMSFVEQYLAIEKLRLGERLRVEIECEERTKSVFVPVLSLQPLVENSVVHGIQHLAEGGTITLKSFFDEKHLVVEVSNPFQTHESSKNNGLALENIRQRLKLLYGEKASLTVQSVENVFVVSLRLPL